MNTFYEEIDEKIKNLLTGEIPAVLNQKNKELLKEIKSSVDHYSISLRAKEIVANFLLMHRYKPVEMFSKNPDFDHKVNYNGKDQTFKVYAVTIKHDTLQNEIFNKTSSDYTVYLFDGNKLAIIKTEKLDLIGDKHDFSEILEFKIVEI